MIYQLNDLLYFPGDDYDYHQDMDTFFLATYYFSIYSRKRVVKTVPTLTCKGQNNLLNDIYLYFIQKVIL